MFKKSFLAVVILTALFACTSDDTNTSSERDNFDRTAMLSNLADNIISPAYQDLDSKLGMLVTAKNDFIATPSQTTLDNFRDSWFTAYKIWQYVEMFNIGKAEEIQYHFQMNIYPTNSTDIENNISSGTYDLTIPNNNDAVGFPALDYLLYGIAQTDAAIIEKYSTNTEATKYKTYISDITDQMKSLNQEVLSDWNNSYRDTFVSSIENTASSAVNKFVNDYIFYYEKGLRANKIGIPAGIFSTTPLPEKVEGFYNKEISKELSITALNAVQDIFNGKEYNSTATGSSFSAYLTQLNKADLATMINNQFDVAREKIEVLDVSFYNQVITDNTKMTQAYDALQVAVVLLKVDMLQAFNISVDYVDADGD
jgi:predicted lipoprotein